MIRNTIDFIWFAGNPGVCRQIPQSSMLRDVIWATHTCVISFNTIGIWPEGADGTDVNNCTRSDDGKLLATGDDFGRVKLFSYPVCQPKVVWAFCIEREREIEIILASIDTHVISHVDLYSIQFWFLFQSLYHSYGGHSSHVTNVSFLQDDSRLVSTGGADTSVLQWIVN